ncbi:MAG TPA: dihydropteroate synthase [Bacteroidales bacterium]|nr:dihydropteroate synthase [Bacteroidales bacterium]
MNLSTPLVMGIINITPDSFYDGNKFKTTWDVLKHAEMLLDQGAHILDIGAASTRPGARLITTAEETEKLKPVIQGIIKRFPETIISIDTYNSQTAIMAIGEGAGMINDVSAGQIDPEMFTVIALLKSPYVLTHMQGTPENMQHNPAYQDITKEVALFFTKKINTLNQLGVHDIIIDPGFGFGKTLEDNYRLLNQLDFFRILNLPLMVGISRKSMVYKIVGSGPEGALNGTTSAHTLALLKGAGILRVHDVREAFEALKIVEMYKNQSQN